MIWFNAIVGYAPIDEEQAKVLGLPIIYESEFVILPLIQENIYHFEITHDIDSIDYSDNVTWDRNTISIFAKLLGLKKYAIITAENPDFYGSCYENGEKLIQGTDINSALRILGVPKDGGSEFSYLNLDNYRNSEVYYMKSWVEHNGGDNIIPGTVLYPDYNK